MPIKYTQLKNTKHLYTTVSNDNNKYNILTHSTSTLVREIEDVSSDIVDQQL